MLIHVFDARWFWSQTMSLCRKRFLIENNEGPRSTVHHSWRWTGIDICDGRSSSTHQILKPWWVQLSWDWYNPQFYDLKQTWCVLFSKAFWLPNLEELENKTMWSISNEGYMDVQRALFKSLTHHSLPPPTSMVHQRVANQYQFSGGWKELYGVLQGGQIGIPQICRAYHWPRDCLRSKSNCT